MANPTAAQLKEEGNQFFAAKKYRSALAKYTQAIELDGANAILYANRAQCAIQLKLYTPAECDAKKATELDPSYSKAWARLAKSQHLLGFHEHSIQSWEKALSLLPSVNPSSMDQRLRTEYQACLLSVQENMAEIDENIRTGRGPITMTKADTRGRMPWDVADEMLADLQHRQDAHSSAWVIGSARQAFQRGMGNIAKLQQEMTSQGPRYHGQCGAIADLLEGIMQDDRVFSVDERFARFNDQVMFECAATRAWSTGDASEVIRNAQSRLATEGWDATRPALSFTVRAIVMRGLLQSKLAGDPTGGEPFIAKALEILEIGNRIWKDVPHEVKGKMFLPTFVRGVRSIHLGVYLAAYMDAPGKNELFTLDGLHDFSEELRKDCAANPPVGAQPSPGYLLSYHVYPRTEALISLGLYHKVVGKASGPYGSDAATDHYIKAAEYYSAATENLPHDDEKYAWYLYCSLDCLFKAYAPLQVTLPFARRVREAAMNPTMKRLWAHSSLAKGGRDKTLQRAVSFLQDAEIALERGELTEDSVVGPPECLED